MRILIRGMAMAIAGAACALWIVAPAFSGTSVTTSTGEEHQVWEHRQRVIIGSAEDGPWAIGFAVIDSMGRREGLITGTQDLARDSFPRIALDPRQGDPVVVWSRFDGSVLKIAHARFQQGAWGEPRLVTFGPGDDTHPRLGIGLSGPYLFWISKERYLYAPIDLSTGHLYAPPRPLSVPKSKDDGTTIEEPGLITLQGGSDIPIWTAGACKHGGNGKPCATDDTPKEPGSTIQGTSDAPIIFPDAATANLWDVASHPGCRGQVIAIPERDFSTVTLLSFNNGTIRRLGKVTVPDPIPDYFGAQVAASILPSVCY